MITGGGHAKGDVSRGEKKVMHQSLCSSTTAQIYISSSYFPKISGSRGTGEQRLPEQSRSLDEKSQVSQLYANSGLNNSTDEKVSTRRNKFSVSSLLDIVQMYELGLIID